MTRDNCPGCGGSIVRKTNDYGGVYRGCKNCAFNVDKDEAGTPVLKQMEAIRRSGKTNMFDLDTVQVIAYESEFHALVTWIEEHSMKEVHEMGGKAKVKYTGKELDLQVPETITRTVEI